MIRLALLLAIIQGYEGIESSGIDRRDYTEGYELALSLYNGGYYAIRINKSYQVRLHKKKWIRKVR